MEQFKKRYYDAVYDTDREQALAVVEQAIADGVSPEDIVFHIVVPSIDEMVKSFTQTFDSSIAQHFIATQIAAEVTERMVAQFAHQPEPVGRVVLGTSYGDFHGLGKKIVSGCLKTMMIDVMDLGMSVMPETFVEEAVSSGAEVIGIASMMVHTACGANGCLKVRQLLRERGLEHRIKLIVGGAPYRYDHTLYQTVQADAWAANGLEAGRKIIELIRSVNEQ